jgi:hypothetical protein
MKQTLENLIKTSKLSEDEIKSLLKNHPPKRTYTERNIEANSYHTKIGVVSDLHMGHNKYRPDILKDAIHNFEKSKIDFVCIPGDICEGMSGRDGHIYELTHTGASQQLDYATEQLSQIQHPIYAITASHSHDGWFMNKGDMGLDVGVELERRIPNFTYLGCDDATLNLQTGIKINMIHPGGGTAYALSYKLQKHINSLSGGEKPNVLLQGHYHKAIYMLYRNVHAFESGCLEDQTKFMKKIGTPAMTGYWIIDIYANKKKSVDKIIPEFYPFY